MCLDGSSLAETVLEPAQALGRPWQADYRLLRVIAPPGQLNANQDDPLSAHEQRLIEQARQDAEAYLTKVAGRMRTTALTVETRLTLSRNVAAAMLHEAQSAHCDLIAISTHGRGGLSRLLLGSVADKVSRSADRPVLVYRPLHSSQAT